MPQSSVAAEPTTYNWSGEAHIGPTTTDRILTRTEFVMVQQAWAVVDPRFDTLLDDYKKVTRKMRIKPTLKKWQLVSSVKQGWPTSDREEMLRMKNMSRKCTVNVCTGVGGRGYNKIPLLLLKHYTCGINLYYN